MSQSQVFRISHEPSMPAINAPKDWVLWFGSSSRARNTGHAMATARANAQVARFIHEI